MSTWVIAYIDQPITFWQDLYAQFRPHVREVYFPMPGQGLCPGCAQQPRELAETFLQNAPIDKSVLVNPVVPPLAVEQIGPPICEAMRELYDEFGVRRVVVSSPTLARLIRERLPLYQITASVLMGIVAPAQALMVADVVDVIVPDTRLIRDLLGLWRLREAFSGEVRQIVNEACLGAVPTARSTSLRWATGAGSRSRFAGRCWKPSPGCDSPGHGFCRSICVSMNVSIIGGGPGSALQAVTISDELFEYTLTCDKN